VLQDEDEEEELAGGSENDDGSDSGSDNDDDCKSLLSNHIQAHYDGCWLLSIHDIK
jgi:hypothetical protein